jgi:uncharacterized membrane protein YgaE (UPF0421/DUF939 family)
MIVALLVYQIFLSPAVKNKREEKKLRKILDHMRSDVFDQNNENVRQAIRNLEDSLLRIQNDNIHLI